MEIKSKLAEFTVIASQRGQEIKRKVEPVARKTVNTVERHPGKVTAAGVVVAAVAGKAAFEAVKHGDLGAAGTYLQTLTNQITTAISHVAAGNVPTADILQPQAKLGLTVAAGAGLAANRIVKTHEERTFNKNNIPVVHFQAAQVEPGLAVISPKLAERFERSNKLSVESQDGSMKTYMTQIQEDLDGLQIYTSDSLGDAVKVAPTTRFVPSHKVKVSQGTINGVSYAMARSLQADAQIGQTMVLTLEDEQGIKEPYVMPIVEGDKKFVTFTEVPKHRYASLEPTNRNYVTPQVRAQRALDTTKRVVATGVEYGAKIEAKLEEHAIDMKNAAYRGLGKLGSTLKAAGEALEAKSSTATKKDEFDDQFEYFMSRTSGPAYTAV